MTRDTALGGAAVLQALKSAPQIASVAPAANPGGAAVAVVAESAIEDLMGAHLEGVREIFDDSFAGRSEHASTFDITGWYSGITREMLDPAVMERWVEATIATLRSLAPRSVLEIGCGTGLLLTRLAPGTARYVGTDLSPAVLDRLRSNLNRAGLDLDHLELELRAADDVAGLDGGFDLVVINSVVQYFPSADYLAGVIESAASVLAPNGAVFVGDVRDLRLLTEYHAEAARYQAATKLSPDELAQDVRRREAEEPELVLDPAFFRSLPARLVRALDVDVRERTGGGDDELRRYRYDVLLRASGPTPRARHERVASREPSVAEAEGPDGSGAPPARVATEPALGRLVRELRRELSAVVSRRLPDWDVPLEVRLVGPPPLPADGAAVLLSPVTPGDGASAPAATGSAGASAAAARAVLVEAWRELLALDEVDDQADFFELGGHSLLATQLVARVRETLGVGVGLSELVYGPTLGEMVDAVMAAAQAQSSAEGEDPGATRGGGGGANGAAVPELRRRPASGEPAPLSFAQERLWFLSQRDPESRAYHVPYGVPWRGPLDVDALRRALSGVVARHEALRTRFAVTAGVPVQEAAPAGPVPIEVVDAVSWGAEEVARVTAAFAREPFDLRAGSLLRARVLRRGPEDHVLVLVLHHIATDGWSVRVLFDELAALYSAFSAGHGSPLSELALQYADFAAWQREWLAGPLLDAQLAHWRGALAGAPDLLELPTDRLRPVMPSGDGALLRFSFGAELTNAARGLAREGRTTLFTVLLSAFGVVLSRWSGRDDLVVGTPVANRPRRELEGLIGFFANTLPLRVDLTGDPGFVLLLDRVRAASLGAFANQDVPFERLVEELAPERTLSHAPLVQVVLALQNTEQASAVEPAGAAPEGAPGASEGGFPRSRFNELELDKGASKFELTVSLEETDDGGLLGLVEYDRDLYDESTVERLTAHLATVLEGASADPGAPLSRLPLLTPGERAWLLDHSAGPVPAAPAATTVHELVAAQARATPDAPAVVTDGGGELTYSELYDRAIALAGRLRESGAGPGEVVGVCLPRSADLIVAVLAVLHAGAAYLPLDPEYPAERLELMTSDAGVRLAIAPDAFADSFPASVTAISMDTSACAPAAAAAFAHPPLVDPAACAYVVYTSGSTGAPKGVAVPHRAIVNLVTTPTYCTVGTGDRVAQASTTSFDAFTFEVWGALTTGAAVVLLDREDLLDPDALAAAILRAGITTMFLTTSVFDLVARVRPEAFAPLRTLLFGGEAIDVRSAAAVLGAGPPGRLVHVYGPTEATTFASSHDVRPEDVVSGVVPIGLPLQGVALHVLDREMRPVPAGVVGDLHVAGPGLALGYLGKPEMTTRAFPLAPAAPPGSGPWPLAEGTRLYRTGDLARRRADGRIVYTGREDRQVKVRGYRVELDEIETMLEQLPQVAAAAVVLRHSATAGSQIVAYVVPAPDAPAEVTAAALASELRKRLPAYTLPQQLVLLEAFPLGATGKVDRLALPEADAADANAGGGDGRALVPGARVEPRDEVERGLHEIWSGLLERRDFGVTEDFFSLGGHSLLVSRMVSAVRARFEIELPLRTAFERPTVGELAVEVLARTMAELDLDAIDELLASAEVADGTD